MKGNCCHSLEMFHWRRELDLGTVCLTRIARGHHSQQLAFETSGLLLFTATGAFTELVALFMGLKNCISRVNVPKI